MPDRHLLVLQRLVIDGHAERRSDLVLPRVTLSDVAAVVEQRPQLSSRLQIALDALRHLDHVRLVSRQGNHRNLHRRKIRMQVQDGALLAALECLFLVAVHQERERDAIHAARRLDDVRRQMLIRRDVEVRLLQDGVLVRNGRAVLEARLAAFRVARQIVVRTIRNAFDFVELLLLVLAFRKEAIEQVRRRLRVVRQFVGPWTYCLRFSARMPYW